MNCQISTTGPQVSVLFEMPADSAGINWYSPVTIYLSCGLFMINVQCLLMYMYLLVDDGSA